MNFSKNIIIHECSYWLLHEQIIHENFISFQVDDNTMKYSWILKKNNNSWIFMNVHINYFMSLLFMKISWILVDEMDEIFMVD